MTDEKTYVVDAEQISSKDFVCLKQMADIGTREILTAVTITAGIYSCFVSGVHEVAHVNAPLCCEGCTMSRQPCWYYAVKNVHAA